MRTDYADRHREYQDMHAMTDRLVAEYAGVVSAEAVAGCIARCRERLLKTGVERGLVPATEAAARVTLAATAPVRV